MLIIHNLDQRERLDVEYKRPKYGPLGNTTSDFHTHSYHLTQKSLSCIENSNQFKCTARNLKSAQQYVMVDRIGPAPRSSNTKTETLEKSLLTLISFSTLICAVSVIQAEKA